MAFNSGKQDEDEENQEKQPGQAEPLPTLEPRPGEDRD